MKSAQKRKSLVVTWDFQNIALDAEQVRLEWYWMDRFLGALFPNACSNATLIAYTQPFHSQAARVLAEYGFEVKNSGFDADSQLIRDVENIYGFEPQTSRDLFYPISGSDPFREPLEPQESVFVLVANDGHYSDLLTDLKDEGGEVYLWANDKVSEKLERVVGKDHLIPWERPYVAMRCVDSIKSLGGKATTMNEFAEQCMQYFDEDGYEVYPPDAGFSKNRPYRSVLNMLQRYDVIKTKPVGGKSSKMRFSLLTVV